MICWASRSLAAIVTVLPTYLCGSPPAMLGLGNPTDTPRSNVFQKGSSFPEGKCWFMRTLKMQSLHNSCCHGTQSMAQLKWRQGSEIASEPSVMWTLRGFYQPVCLSSPVPPLSDQTAPFCQVRTFKCLSFLIPPLFIKPYREHSRF